MVHHRAGRCALVLFFAATAVAGPATAAWADDGGDGRCDREGVSCDCEVRNEGRGNASSVTDSGRRGGDDEGDEQDDEGDRQRGRTGGARERDDDEFDPACLPAPVVPEAPIAVLLPLSAIGVAGAVMVVRRRTRAAVTP